MNCQTYTEGSCSNFGKNWRVRNTSTNTEFRYQVDVLENGKPFSSRSGELAPGAHEPLNVCSRNGADRYDCRVVGEVAI